MESRVEPTRREMGSLIVDKRTLQILIRSADQARKDLMDFNRSLQEKHLPSPDGFAGKVREVRKIHDFLGRAGRSPEDRLSLDFALKERILLGSCLHHLKAQVDIDIRVPGLGKSQRRVLEETRTKINFLIAKMHAPGVSLLVKNGQLTLNADLDIDPDQTTLDIDLTEDAHSAVAPESEEPMKLYNGSRFAFNEVNLSPGATGETDQENNSVTEAAGLGNLRLSNPREMAREHDSEPAPTGAPAQERAEDYAADPGRDQRQRPKGLFNPRMVADPKIRTLARLDLQDFQQAKQKLSLRRMLVHLLGCFEALLLDHAMQNLDLYGMDLEKVAEWDFRALTHRIFSGKFDAHELQVLDCLFKARDYLSAARMYSEPRVLTRAMVQSVESLTRWMISDLGYDQVHEVEASTDASSPKLWRSKKG